MHTPGQGTDQTTASTGKADCEMVSRADHAQTALRIVEGIAKGNSDAELSYRIMRPVRDH